MEAIANTYRSRNPPVVDMALWGNFYAPNSEGLPHWLNECLAKILSPLAGTKTKHSY